MAGHHLGAGFSDLALTDFRVFDTNTKSVYWTIPPLPRPDFDVQALAFDPANPTPWPLTTSNVRSIDVQ